MPMLTKNCKHCDRPGHNAFNCLVCPRKPLKVKKPMRKVGKVAKKWLETRDKWLEANKAPYYFCYYCDKMLTRTQLTLDHKQSRSRNPELRYARKNLVPCCLACNTAKGSLSAEEFIEKRRID